MDGYTGWFSDNHRGAASRLCTSQGLLWNRPERSAAGNLAGIPARKWLVDYLPIGGGRLLCVLRVVQPAVRGRAAAGLDPEVQLPGGSRLALGLPSVPLRLP